MKVLSLFSFLSLIFCNEILKKKINSLLNHKNELLALYQSHKRIENKEQSELLSLLNEIHDDIQKKQLNESYFSSSNRHILTILTDDQGWEDIGYNDPTFLTPTIDFIASQGIKFDNFYVHVNQLFFTFFSSIFPLFFPHSLLLFFDCLISILIIEYLYPNSCSINYWSLCL